MEEEIPCYFLCPISMQMMTDPVTVSTGITYDRESIERWLFSCKKGSCPVTKQPLNPAAAGLTPNHTLRRLIQAWCTLNHHHAIPTPKSETLNLLQRLSSNDAVVRDEALTILQQVELSDSDLKSFFTDNNNIMSILIHVLQNGDSENRAGAITVLKNAFAVADPIHLIGSGREVFIEAVRILNDRISMQTTKAAMKLLVELCPWGKNRFKAVKAGAVAALIELLLDTADRRACELGLTALDQLCGCADGRAELLRHGAGLAVVSKKILRVSGVASDRAVRIVAAISRYSANSRVLQEMVKVGVVTKLCLVVQVEASHKTKERIREILRLHSRVWKESSCIPPHLLSFYPS